MKAFLCTVDETCRKTYQNKIDSAWVISIHVLISGQKQPYKPHPDSAQNMNGCLCPASPKHYLIRPIVGDSSLRLFCVSDNAVLGKKTVISWRTDITAISNHCFPDLEYVIIRCGPFHCYLKHSSFCLARFKTA